MDDDFGSPFGLMGLMSMFASVVAMLLFVVLWGGVIAYVLARWRQNRAPVEDPQFGLKFALHLFRVLGFHALLLGAFLLVYAVLLKGNSDERSPVWRSAFGLLVPGGILFGTHTLLLASVTNQAAFPLIGRMFAGLSLIMSGLVGSIAMIVACQMLFAKGSSGDAGRAVWSAVLVYLSAWGVQGVMFVSRHAPPDGAAPPQAGGMVAGPPVAPAPAVPEPMRQPLS